jgi:hypothetical protein
MFNFLHPIWRQDGISIDAADQFGGGAFKSLISGKNYPLSIFFFNGLKKVSAS